MLPLCQGGNGWLAAAWGPGFLLQLHLGGGGMAVWRGLRHEREELGLGSGLWDSMLLAYSVIQKTLGVGEWSIGFTAEG